MARIVHNTAREIYALPRNVLVDFNVVETPLQVDSSAVGKVHEDTVYDLTSGETYNNAKIEFNNVPLDETPYVLSSDVGVASVSGNFDIEWVSDGTVTITVGAQGRGQRRFTRTMVVDDPKDAIVVTGFGVGTASETVLADMLALVSGKSPSHDTQAYITSHNADLDNPEITINPNFFASGLDWSPISVLRTGRTNDAFPITLVTSRHGITAWHVRPSVGDEVLYRRNDGTFQKVTVLGIDQIAEDIWFSDLVIVYFDAAVTGITPSQVYSTDEFTNNFPALVTSHPDYPYTISVSAIPILRKSMHFADEAYGSSVVLQCLWTYGYDVREETNQYYGIGFGRMPMVAGIADQFPGWMPEGGIGGDSGGPLFMLRDGNLVLLTTESSAGGGTYISQFISEINTAMDTLAGDAPGTWTLTEWAA